MSNDAKNNQRHDYETVVLASLPNELAAELIVEALEDADIESQRMGGVTAGFRAEAPGWVKVMVRKEDLPRALEALHAFRKSNEEIDWSQIDFGDDIDEDESAESES